MCITGYTCADLFQQTALQTGALNALGELARASSERFSGLAVVGLPLAVDDQLFNCAALLERGRILGIVPKSFLPTYKEYYERRWFAALLAGPDDAAFEALVRRHGLMVYRVCWRVLQHAQDCEDAFQATFLLLARKLGSLKKRNSLAA